MGESGGKEEEECKPGPDLQVCSVKKKVDGRCGKQRFTGKQYVVLDNGIYKTSNFMKLSCNETALRF